MSVRKTFALRDKSGNNRFRSRYYKKKSDIDLPCDFNEDAKPDCSREDFLRLLQASLALSYDEKMRVIKSLPKLSTFQVNELVKVLEEEYEEFVDHYRNNKAEVDELIKSRDEDWRKLVSDLRSHLGQMFQYCRYGLKTPETIAALVSEHVLAQSRAVRAIASLLYWHQLNQTIANAKSKVQEYKPVGPVLLIGPTGVGKSFLVEKACEAAGVPYIHCDASSMVSEGIVGFSTNDLGKLILAKAGNDPDKAERAVIFMDEFDKLSTGGTYGQDVLNQILRVIEGTELRISPDRWDSERDRLPRSLSTSKMLFILGGAYQHLYEAKSTPGFTNAAAGAAAIIDPQKLGLPKEMQGRIRQIIGLNRLEVSDYLQILKAGKSSPLADYERRLSNHGITVALDDDALEAVAEHAAASSCGARALRQVLDLLFEELVFTAPSQPKQSCSFTRQDVERLQAAS